MDLKNDERGAGTFITITLILLAVLASSTLLILKTNNDVRQNYQIQERTIKSFNIHNGIKYNDLEELKFLYEFYYRKSVAEGNYSMLSQGQKDAMAQYEDWQKFVEEYYEDVANVNLTPPINSDGTINIGYRIEDDTHLRVYITDDEYEIKTEPLILNKTDKATKFEYSPNSEVLPIIYFDTDM